MVILYQRLQGIELRKKLGHHHNIMLKPYNVGFNGSYLGSSHRAGPGGPRSPPFNMPNIFLFNPASISEVIYSVNVTSKYGMYH